MKTTLAVVVMTALAAPASAQFVAHAVQGGTIQHEQQLQVVREAGVASGLYATVSFKTVPGAPYSAEAVTESVQALADGNRIVHRRVTRVYRDSKGRTRQETLDADGVVKSVVIYDPVAKASFVLDPAAGTARRVATASYVTLKIDGAKTSSGVAGGVVAKREGEEMTLHLSTGTGGIVGGTPVTVTHASGPDAKGTKEDLGRKTFEGVEATGTRTTTVIPAGAIGNELPMTIVGEEWYSPELQVLLMTRHADPRTGESTYRLTGITRTEPNQWLFEVPAGYTIK